MQTRTKAQSTIEYILLVTAVIACTVFFLVGPGRIGGQFGNISGNSIENTSGNTSGNISLSPFQQKITQVYSSAADGAERNSKRLVDSLTNYPVNSAN